MYYNKDLNVLLGKRNDLRGMKEEYKNSFISEEILLNEGYLRVKKVGYTDYTEFSYVVANEPKMIDGVPVLEYTKHYLELDNAKEVALKKAKEDREKTLLEPINNIQVHRTKDRENLQNSLEFFDNLATDGKISWTMADNTEEQLTKEDLIEAITSYVTRKAEAFELFQNRKIQIEEAITPEEVEAIFY